jgi:magnesium transporter
MLNAYNCQTGHLQRCGTPVTAEALQDTVWIDLLRPEAEEVSMVEQATKFHVPTMDEVSEIESSSRLASHNGTLYLSLPLVSAEEGTTSSVSAGFVLSRDRLITVRFSDSRVFDLYAEKAPLSERPQHSAPHVMVGLLEALVDRQADALEQVRAELDTLSRNIFRLGARGASGRKKEDAKLRQALTTIGRIGELLSHVRDTQVGIARMLPYIQSTANDWLPTDLNSRLDVMGRDIASLSSFDNFVSEKLQFLLDATLGFISIAQNNVMKVLTVASVVGIPPVLVAGIYGMNFKEMPELNWAYGYAFGWALIIISTIIPLVLFRLNKWI